MDLEEIFHQHKELVYNLALNYLQNEQDAQEVSQDVFIKVNDKLSGFKQQSTLKTWIYRITINQAKDFLKAKKRIKRGGLFKILPIDQEANNIGEINHPGIQIEQKEAIERILHKLNELNANQKSVIILLKIDGLSVQEAAMVMELSHKAVESLFQRAKKNLKILLDKNEE